MSCGHCTAAITKKIAALDPSAIVSTDLDRRTVEVETRQTGTAIAQTMKAVGYASELLT
ncbi:heavy-metal-associated domain-containing protein [Marivita sp. S0852]|uniref:heavy-metal-associated domain-containing protein n=1 Tax=Marivita sp. S0852 TaxID=3373893 RepID=UPI003982D01C